ncbi:MAG: hypothetical protein WAP55_01450 [Minisyncoccia bacterium]
MITQTRTRTAHLPLALHQAAESLKKLSKNELETLELLLDKETSRVIKRSVSQAKKGQMRELKP